MYLTQKQFVPAIIILAIVAGVFYWAGSRGADSPDSSIASSTALVATNTNATESPIEDFTAQPIKNRDKTGSEVVSTPTPLSGKMAPELVRPGGFSNTDPFLLRDFRGKRIVLLEFWTTSSINSVRTIPYLNDWYAKYNNYGLTIIAVHTPRFNFERSKTVPDRFAASNNMAYPLVIDNGAETWTAYKNATWPHLYIIDLDGRIAYDHSGEGAYDATERKLLALLNDRAAKLKLPAPPEQKITKLSADTTDLSQLGSSEALFGSARNKNLANGTPGKDGIQTFSTLTEPKLNMEYLFGGWKITRDYAENLTEQTSIIYRFHAKHVYTIMGTQKLVRVKVLLDGKPLDTATAGKDVRFEKGESIFYVDRERLYDIVNLGSYADHTIELTPETGGLDVYTLTFG